MARALLSLLRDPDIRIVIKGGGSLTPLKFVASLMERICLVDFDAYTDETHRMHHENLAKPLIETALYLLSPHPKSVDYKVVGPTYQLACDFARFLGRIPAKYKSGLESEIKKFLRSLLEEFPYRSSSHFWEYEIPRILINNGMLEELANPNYQFHESKTIIALANHVFENNRDLTSIFAKYYPTDAQSIKILWPLIREAYKAPPDRKKCHELNILERLLARAGGLDRLEVK